MAISLNVLRTYATTVTQKMAEVPVYDHTPIQEKKRE